jgi:hypothetical protein
MQPVHIDVFYPLPEGWGMCSTCELFLAQADLAGTPETRGRDEYPPEFQEEFQRFSSLVIYLADRYKDHISIRIWDPRSLQGLIKSIHHGIRHYPTFILNRRVKFVGWDTQQLLQQIQAALET